MNKIKLLDIERELDCQDNLISPKRSLEYNNRIFQRYCRSSELDKIHYRDLLEIIFNLTKRIYNKLNEPEGQK